jgi:hypothetical protein
MAWTWPIERFLVVSPFIGYGIYGGLLAWTLWYRKKLRDRAGGGVQANSMPG